VSSTAPLYVESQGSGRPVLLIHGFGATMYTWRHVVPLLARRHEVITVDLKGAGRAAKPPDGHYSVHDQAGHVADLITSRNLRDLTLIGHSFGGGVVLATAIGSALAPGHLRNLVLIDSMAYRQTFPWFIAALRTPVLGPLSLWLLPTKWQVRLVLRSGYHRPGRIAEDTVLAYATPLRLAAGRRALIDTAKAMPPRDADALAEQYPQITLPTLMLWGRHDAIVPLRIGERLHQAIRTSRLVVIEDAGHLPHEETPERVWEELTRFLTESHGGGP
jgi:pimeloyl-ACP methyl ester carboxylesterase